MCRPVTCKKCGKAGWAGCGAHVEQVLGAVPAADRCQCGTNTKHRATKTKHGAKAKRQTVSAGAGNDDSINAPKWFRKVLGG